MNIEVFNALYIISYGIGIFYNSKIPFTGTPVDSSCYKSILAYSLGSANILYYEKRRYGIQDT